MNYKAHRVGGICAAVITSALIFKGSDLNVESLVAIGLVVTGGALGGELPDIDLPTSKLGKKVPLISQAINKICGHRGFTHTLLCALLFAFMMMMSGNIFPDWIRAFMLPWQIGLLVGYLSHLVLDMTTVSGVPLLFPITTKSIRIAKLRSGKDDLLVSLILILGTGSYLYYSGVLHSMSFSGILHTIDYIQLKH